MALKEIKERCMGWGMIVRLSFLRKSILDPKIFMRDSVFVDGCLSQFFSKLSVANRASKLVRSVRLSWWQMILSS